MKMPQLIRSLLLFMAAALIPGAVGYGLAQGRFDTDMTVLAALAIAGIAGYALGRGVSPQP